MKNQHKIINLWHTCYDSNTDLAVLETAILPVKLQVHNKISLLMTLLPRYNKLIETSRILFIR